MISLGGNWTILGTAFLIPSATFVNSYYHVCSFTPNTEAVEKILVLRFLAGDDSRVVSELEPVLRV